MASTYVNNLRLNEMATGDQSGTWGTTTNTNLELIGQAFGWGTRAIANASTDNITIADGASDADRSMALKLTGGGQACTVTILPNTSAKVWIMENATSYTLTFTQGSGANVAILAGETKMIATDGLGSGAVVYDVLTDLNLAGTTKAAALTVAGTVDAATVEFDNLSGTSAVNVTDIADEDNMASNSATKLATQQSIKAYVDAQVDTADTLTEVLAIGNTTATDQKIQFRDAAIHISSSTDGQLDLVADTEIQIAATTVDINGAVDLSADLSVGDDLTVLGGVIDFKSNSGSPASLKMYCETSNAHFQTLQPQPHSAAASNTLRLPDSGDSGTQDLVAVDTTQTLTNKTLTAPTITGTAVMATLDISGDVDVDGTLEADAITLAGTALASIFSPIAGGGSIVTTGALNSGSITSGFGTINNGSSTITTTGAVSTGTIAAGGKITADAGIDIDNFNIDGTTISLSSGTMEFDSAANIVLDSASRDIVGKVAGTTEFNIHMGTGSTVLGTTVSDRDMAFSGNDGGATITALNLDMSAAGAATFNNDVTAFSDERLKSNITTIPDALSKVNKMRGVHYVRDETGKDSSGVIAQELQKIAPELVLTADDEMGTLSVNYGNITGYLIEAVKELSARVKELEGK